MLHLLPAGADPGLVIGVGAVALIVAVNCARLFLRSAPPFLDAVVLGLTVLIGGGGAAAIGGLI